MTAEPDALRLVKAWLNEPEGYGVRMERLVEDLENGADIIPWLVAAFNLAAALAHPSAQGSESLNKIAHSMNLVLSGGWDEEEDCDWGSKTDETKLDRLDDLLGDLIAALAHPPAQGSESGGEAREGDNVTVLITKRQREAALRSGKKLNDWVSSVIEEAALSPQPGPASEGEGHG